ncbi:MULTISPECIES: glutaredoxin family protein [unclassified Exiguobacterium]|uniref:glutaredoxin family protein n=1 Tax=unclassified Exiguobacterium TaxID=2644629 RepID=UPI00103A6C08|nr:MULTISPECIES: glutaredoxin family protein [unclassified Exiguobacterium]TCI27683.1 glutaredoxin family protein [Exiguobacterium sp. SH5S4]TCI53184.1 glutaredoxin family protein [Exiguobacterium sp. SH5S13]TCI64943.1 glutaredoxin family protein [Exiguobacterium sp. SH3S1]
MVLTLYRRENCSLCEEALVMLEWLQEDYPFELEQIDITGDALLEEKYLFEIPVVLHEGTLISQGRYDDEKVEEFVKYTLTSKKNV